MEKVQIVSVREALLCIIGDLNEGHETSGGSELSVQQYWHEDMETQSVSWKTWDDLVKMIINNTNYISGSCHNEYLNEVTVACDTIISKIAEIDNAAPELALQEKNEEMCSMHKKVRLKIYNFGKNALEQLNADILLHIHCMCENMKKELGSAKPVSFKRLWVTYENVFYTQVYSLLEQTFKEVYKLELVTSKNYRSQLSTEILNINETWKVSALLGNNKKNSLVRFEKEIGHENMLVVQRAGSVKEHRRTRREICRSDSKFTDVLDSIDVKDKIKLQMSHSFDHGLDTQNWGFIAKQKTLVKPLYRKLSRKNDKKTDAKETETGKNEASILEGKNENLDTKSEDPDTGQYPMRTNPFNRVEFTKSIYLQPQFSEQLESVFTLLHSIEKDVTITGKTMKCFEVLKNLGEVIHQIFKKDLMLEIDMSTDDLLDSLIILLCNLDDDLFESIFLNIKMVVALQPDYEKTGPLGFAVVQFQMALQYITNAIKTLNEQMM
jgi:hypothetical protein